MAQFGSFEHERFLRKIQRVRKVAAVKILLPSKERKILGTASVSCIAAQPGNHREIVPYNLIVIHRGVAQFGSFEHERFLRKIQRVRKVAAVKILLPSKERKILGTASVSCVAARPGNHREIIPYNLIVIHRGVAQFGRALRSGRRGRRFKSCHLDHFLFR